MLKARRQRLLHSYPKKAGAGLTVAQQYFYKNNPTGVDTGQKIKIVHMETFTTVYALAVQIKEVYDGVQGNKEQCKMLHDQVQHVAASLKALPDPTKRKTEVKAAVSSLRETLRSCLDLIGEFKKTHWIKKAVFHASTTGKFEALFVELDRVLQVCGFALEVRTKQYTFSYRSL